MADQFAIIHTDTRVIRRVTTDSSFEIAADESLIKLAAPIDIGPIGGTLFWKLDGRDQKVAATEADIDAAKVDELREAQKRRLKIQAYQDAVTTAANDPLILGNLKNFFIALRDTF